MDTPAWFQEKTLLDVLDTVEISTWAPSEFEEQPLRVPMLDGFKDMGAVMAVGKVEQGCVHPGVKCIVTPTGVKCTIASVFIHDEPVKFAKQGENVTLKMT